MPTEPRFEDIRPRTRRLGHRILHVSAAPSTMRLAAEQAHEGAPEGLVVVADAQTAGVGRQGREWFSAPASLLATLLLRPESESAVLEPLPLAAGVAMSGAIRRLVGVRPRLKWPNDLLLEGRKVGGFLVEARYLGDRPEYLLLGMGVNGDVRTEDFPESLRDRATSLSLAAGRHVCMPALLKLFLDRFEPLYDELRAGRTESTVLAARDLTETLGRRVRVETEQGPVVGRAHTLGRRGELVVETDRDLIRVHSADCVEVRPAP